MQHNHFSSTFRLRADRPTRRAMLRGGAGLAAALAGGILMPGTNLAARQATPDACLATTEEENRAIVQRWYDILDAGDIEAFPTVLAPVMVQHAADFVDARGVEEVQRSFAPFLTAFPDLRHEIHQWVTDGEFVAVHVTGRGTHQDEFAGIEATGQDVTWNIVTIYRIECGLLAEQWSEVDAIGRLQQLGALPPINAPSAGTPTPSATPAAVADTSDDCPTTSEEENAELVRRWYDEVLTQGNLDQIEQYLHEDHRHWRPLGWYTGGIDARTETIQGWQEAFDGFTVTPDLILTDGDLVVARWTASGTHVGTWEGIEPTGASVSWTGNTIFRIACGRIVEERSEADALSFFQQLGVVQWPPEATPTSG